MLVNRLLANAIPVILGLAVTLSVAAADPVTGPVIDEFGPTWAVPGTPWNLVPGERYRVIMDLAAAPSGDGDPHRGLVTAARFLNVHARHGIDPDDLDLAVVLHGGATRLALNDPAHARRYASPNRDRTLVAALHRAGVAIYLCGQSAGSAGISVDELLPEVTLAVSAMTVHVRLRQEGYRAIGF